jgi:pSer/pThr/pTyr-binding forkhead associated (FHA) protein
MAELVVKFGEKVIKKVSLTHEVVAIGRKPENDIHIENLAVSGKHARIVNEGGKFFVEDLESLNGTFLNGEQISKAELQHNAVVTIGKHTLVFIEMTQAPSAAPVIEPDSFDKTMVLDTKKHKEMVSGEKAAPPQQAAGGAKAAPPQQAAGGAKAAPPQQAAGGAKAAPPQQAAGGGAPPQAAMGTGVLTVVDGKAEQDEFVLSGRSAIIGKGTTAAIRIKGLFAPQIAAQISRVKEGFVLSAPEGGKPPNLNGLPVEKRALLKDGDVFETGGVTFRLTIRKPGA